MFTPQGLLDMVAALPITAEPGLARRLVTLGDGRKIGDHPLSGASGWPELDHRGGLPGRPEGPYLDPAERRPDTDSAAAEDIWFGVARA